MKTSIQIVLAGIFATGMLPTIVNADEPAKAKTALQKPEGKSTREYPAKESPEVKRTETSKQPTSSSTNRAVIRNTRPNENEKSGGLLPTRGQVTHTGKNETGAKTTQPPVEHKLSEKERAYIAGLLELSKEQAEKLGHLHKSLAEALAYIKEHKKLSNAEKMAKTKEVLEKHENAVKNLLSAEQYKKLIALRHKIGERREGGGENGGGHKPGEANQGRPSGGSGGLGRVEGGGQPGKRPESGSRPKKTGAQEPAGTPESEPRRPEGRPEPLTGPEK